MAHVAHPVATAAVRKTALLLAAPVVLATVFSWTQLPRLLTDVPADSEYDAARVALVDAKFSTATDALVILPPWSLRPLAVLGGFAPISGDHVAAQPLDRYARLFVLAEPQANKELDPLVARLGSPKTRLSLGRSALLQFDLGGVHAGYDFRAHITDARVGLMDANGQATTQCTLPTGRRFVQGAVCPGGAVRATREWLLVSENADDAIYAHPPARGQALAITFADVLMGQAIVVRAGHTRAGADRAQAPVHVRVHVGDAFAGDVVRDPAFGFTTDVIDTAAWQGQTKTVRFELSTDNDTGQDFAFDAFVRTAVPR